MGRALLVLHNDAMRAKATDWIARAPKETRVTFQGPKRSVPQNDRLWASLTEIAEQIEWHGVKLGADSWKLIFLDALKHEIRLAPNLSGTGFVNLGRSSSDLSKAEFADLLTLIYAWGAEHGVIFHEPEPIITPQLDFHPQPANIAQRSPSETGELRMRNTQIVGPDPDLSRT